MWWLTRIKWKTNFFKGYFNTQPKNDFHEILPDLPGRPKVIFLGTCYCPLIRLFYKTFFLCFMFLIHWNYMRVGSQCNSTLDALSGLEIDAHWRLDRCISVFSSHFKLSLMWEMVTEQGKQVGTWHSIYEVRKKSRLRQDITGAINRFRQLSNRWRKGLYELTRC